MSDRHWHEDAKQGDAHRYIVREIEWDWDQAYMGSDSDAERLEIDNHYLDAHADLHNMSAESEYAVYAGSPSLVVAYWVQSCTEADCLGEDD